MSIRTKICGLKTEEAVRAAEAGGAEFLGFVFYPPSPRYITPAAAGIISRHTSLKKVAVVVEATDELLDDIIRNLNPDYIQLHGKETEKRAKEIREKFDIKLIRSVIASEQRERGNPDWIASSSQATSRNDELYSFLLFDSEGGGTGKQFDYSGFKAPSQPWFLSGGLNAGNVAAAAKATGAKLLDVSSGVEREKGVKDPQKIIEFLKVVNGI